MYLFPFGIGCSYSVFDSFGFVLLSILMWWVYQPYRICLSVFARAKYLLYLLLLLEMDLCSAERTVAKAENLRKQVRAAC